jgi:hypothetical protein
MTTRHPRRLALQALPPGALQQTTLLRDLGRALRSPLSVFRRPKDETFWALKDVSVDVHEGARDLTLGTSAFMN